MKKRSRPGRSRSPGKLPPKKKKKSGPPKKTPKRPAPPTLPFGKVRPALLEKCLDEAIIEDPMVLQGAEIGADAAILQGTQNDLLVVTSDPITFTSTAMASHLLDININDIVTSGAYPRWLVLTLLLPEGTGESEVERFFAQLGRACRDHEVCLIGGHTEVTDAVSRPVGVGTLIGLLRRDRRVDPSRARPGNSVLLAGSIAVEGTALLARECHEQVIEAHGETFQRQAAKLLDEPGICLREPASLATSRYVVHALHDPTEGGIATALRELAAHVGHGLEIDRDAIDVLPQTRAICELFKISPYGLLASGALLIVLEEEEAPRLQAALEQHLDCPSRVIGHLTSQKTCLWRDGDGTLTPIPEFTRDEIARVLEG